MARRRRNLCTDCGEEPMHPGFTVCKYCLGEQALADVQDLTDELSEQDRLMEDMMANGYTELSEEG